MNCNILQIISLKFVHNGDYQKNYYFFCHKKMKLSYMFGLSKTNVTYRAENEFYLSVPMTLQKIVQKCIIMTTEEISCQQRFIR